MALAPLPEARLTPVALFPEHYFLENLAVRADGSLLVTAVLQRELWYVPAPDGDEAAAERATPPVSRRRRVSTGLSRLGVSGWDVVESS